MSNIIRKVNYGVYLQWNIVLPVKFMLRKIFDDVGKCL